MAASLWSAIFGHAISKEDLTGPEALSEDACDDLVHSLVRLGYLTNILTSLDGKVFITQEQLTFDIVDLLKTRNGRVSVLDLPKALNAKSDDIQTRIADLMKTCPGTYFLFQDEFVTVPMPLQALQARHVVQDQFFYALCDILSKDPELPGVFKGIYDQGLFIPRPYKQQQTEMIETFFRNNGFIEYTTIKKHGVSDPKSYILKNHPTALLLESHAIKESIWSIVDATVEDCISNLSWVDVKTLVPSPLTKQDVSSLLAQLPCLKDPATCHTIALSSDQDHSLTGLGGGAAQETSVVQGSIVITSGQLQKCLLRMGPLLDRKLKSLVSWRLSSGEDTTWVDQVDEFVDDDEELEGFAAKTLSTRTNNNNSKAVGGGGGVVTTKKLRKQFQDFLTIHDVKEEIRNMEPEFDPVLVNAVAGTLYKDLLLNLRDRSRSVVLNHHHHHPQAEDEENIGTVHPATFEKDIVDSIQYAARHLSDRIRLAAKGIDVIEDVAVQNSLSKYLIQSWCTEMLDLLLLSCALVESKTLSQDNTINTSATTPEAQDAALQTRNRIRQVYNDRERHSSTPTTTNTTITTATTMTEGNQKPFVISTEDQTQLLGCVTPGTASILQKLRKTVSRSCKQKNLNEFMMTSRLLMDSWITLDNDRQDDGHLLRDHMADMRRILTGMQSQANGDDALLLHIVTLIGFQSWTGAMLHASGKFVPRILRQLRSSFPISGSDDDNAIPQKLDLLDTMLSSVLAKVKQQQEQEQEDDEGRRPTQEPLVSSTANPWQDVYNLGMELSKPDM
ncbi:E3 UFM1-protein ligase 1 [Podila humilis]|nr:E3 UFM1-protein ligase 1 [Podila humilis]